MFEHEELQLRELLESKRGVAPDSQPYFSIVARYNEILSRMIDSGLSEPLNDDLLLDPHLLSDKYFQFERRLEQSYTVVRFVKEQCSFVCIAAVTGVKDSTARVEVVEQFWGKLPSHVDIGFFTPWGLDSWFKKREKSIIFLDQSLNSLGLVGRMPIFVREGVEYAASYSEHTDFWPYTAKVREDVLAGGRVYLIELDALRDIFSEMTQESGSLRMRGVKFLKDFRKTRRPATI